jgi:DNA mismatch repair protein MutL
LFYNVPARRKFLKSDETESAHIISAVKNLALAEDSVKFSLYQNGGKIFSSPEICGCGARVNEIFQYGEKFIDFSHSDGNLTICGTICDPEFGNICRKNIVLFVNDRLIRSDMVNSALCEELRPIFPNHRGILAYIFLKIDPAIVDVNVHPMKMEVRFRSELSVRSLIGNCVAEIFGKRGTAIVAESRTTAATPVISVAPVAAAPTRNSSWKSSAFRTPVRSVDVERACRNIPASHGGTKMAISTAEQKVFPTHGGDSGNWCEWRFIGTAFGEIALFESKNGIIVFNIRAAASRVLYEKITSQNENPHSQLLLMPLEITLTDHEIERLQRFLPILSKYGFSIYSFGKRDYKMDAIPEWLRYEDAEILVRDLIIDCENSVKNTPRTNLEEMFARLMARSINLENFKDRDAIEKLRGALLVSKNPLACPLGHATYFEVSLSDMGHRFHEKVK